MPTLSVCIALQVATVAVAPLPGFYSQYGQDKFIIDHFFEEHYGPWRDRGGVFVEVGAGDGIHLSNSLAFEERFGWRGVLIEPVPSAFEALHENRPNCTTLHACIAHTEEEYLLVSNSEDGGLNSFLTTASGLSNTSIVHDRLQCTSLSKALSAFFGGSPGHVDYLSIDVEGNELSVLRSIDFTVYSFDVISVEVDVQDVSVHRFLMAHRFRFVERLVDDAIYVFRRGFTPDPTCMLPFTQLASGSDEEATMLAEIGGWGAVRSLMWSLLQTMTDMVISIALWEGPVVNLLELPAFLISEADRDTINEVVQIWYHDEAHKLLEECPIGMLTISILVRFMEAVFNTGVLDLDSVSELVWRFAAHFSEGTIFHPAESVLAKLGPMVQSRWWDHVKQRESAAEPAGAQRFPLGRAFHEVSFADVLASGWPLFAYLELASIAINRMNAKVIVSKDSSESAAKQSHHHTILAWPKPTCQFQSLGANSSVLNLHDWTAKDLRFADWVQRTLTASSWELNFDADVCGLLAVAAARFQAARANFGDLPKVVELMPLRNWTFVLRQNRKAASVKACPRNHIRAGDAFSPNVYQFLSPCDMEITQAGPAWLQFSRKVLGERTFRQVTEGERLWRSYMKKYGVFSAVAMMNFRPLLPDGLSSAFHDLHDLQGILLDG